MANLIIKKSDTENITIPLTTEKPIARSLAVFKDGQIHYAPLVHSGEYLDSGIKVRIGSSDYALATQVYDPVIYDSSGRAWTATGNPKIHERGQFLCNYSLYIERVQTVALTPSSIFRMSLSFTPLALYDSDTVSLSPSIGGIFGGTGSEPDRVFFQLAANSCFRLYTRINSSITYKASTVTPTIGTTYRLVIEYNNGTTTMTINGANTLTISKKLVARDYKIRFGANFAGISGVIGYIKDVELYFPDESPSTSYLRFGD